MSVAFSPFRAFCSASPEALGMSAGGTISGTGGPGAGAGSSIDPPASSAGWVEGGLTPWFPKPEYEWKRGSTLFGFRLGISQRQREQEEMVHWDISDWEAWERRRVNREDHIADEFNRKANCANGCC